MPIAPRWAGRAVASAHLWAPLLVLAIYCAPFLSFMLPARSDYIAEIYQPLQALKFFATGGSAFHKYGPAPNLVLAPSYGATLAWWHLDGSFSRPTDEFPYGFADPLPQLGFLILQSRVIFLALGVAAFAFLGHRLGTVTRDRLAIGLTLFFCLATNYVVLQTMPTARPDSPMLAFTAAALGVYLGILARGLTPGRAFWLSAFAVLAISSKENAATVFVPPYVGLAVSGWLASRRDRSSARAYWAAVAVGLLTGVVGYALLNIAYAPATWRQRMEFWLVGPGISPEVWGAPSRSEQLRRLGYDLMANLGPGGVVAAGLALAAALIRRPGRLAMLSLPLLGALAGGLQVRYGGERFLTLPVLCFTPLMAIGLGRLRSRLRTPAARASTAAALGVLAAANLAFACCVWFHLYSRPHYLMERYALDHLPRDEASTMLSEWETPPGSTRMEWLGFRVEHRPYQEWSRDPAGMLRFLFVKSDYLDYINDIAVYERRGRMMKDEAGFDFADWRPPEELGYELRARLVPRLSPWLPFRWLPVVRDTIEGDTMLLYALPRGRAGGRRHPGSQRVTGADP